MNKRIINQQEKIEQIKETLLDHGYQYQNPVGHGGFSSVHLVTSIKYSLNFVVKVSERGGSEVSHAEVSALLNLSHPNIISMYEFFLDKDFLYIILELCPGGSLDDLIKESGPLKNNDLFRIFGAIVRALATCHKKRIAHRDIKPANILLDDFGRPKLADFGLSNKFEYGNKFNTYNGTFSFMAPEILMKSPHDPFKTDIWALGVTFYMLATGEIPWKGNSQKELEFAITMGVVSYNHQNIPFNFIPILKKMLVVNPSQRCTAEWLVEQDFQPSLPLKTVSSQHSMGSQLNLIQFSTCKKKGLTSQQSVNNGLKINEKKQVVGSLTAYGSVLSFQRLGGPISRRPSLIVPQVKMTFA